ncbi:unnamed protein product [Victoria cruziana]
MVREGIVLGYIVSERGIEVDKAKVETIAKMTPPSSVREVRSFLGHVGFYRRFIQDFSKISRPLYELLAKDFTFVFSEDCQQSFERLKEALVSAPILRAPDWNLEFEIMCDASDYAIGAILGQRVEKKPVVIYYACKSLVDAQLNYTTTEKEMLAEIHSHWSKNQRDHFLSQVRYFYWEEPDLFRYYANQVFRRCVPEKEYHSIFSFCHAKACGGHYSGKKTAAKVLQSGFFWLTLHKDAYMFCKQ